MAASDPTITIDNQSDLPGGCRIICGSFTPTNTYVTTGTNNEMDISAYLSGSPVVILGTGVGGYVMCHNQGTSAAGKVLIYEAGADGAALDEYANAGDPSAVIADFIAIGTTP